MDVSNKIEINGKQVKLNASEIVFKNGNEVKTVEEHIKKGETLELIKSGTLSTGSTITFSEIPLGYKHLKLVIRGKINRVESGVFDIWFRFNDIESNSYYVHSLRATDTQVTTLPTAVSNRLYSRSIGMGTTGTSITTLDIYDYRSASLKAIECDYQAIGLNTGEQGRISALFTLNAPITKIFLGTYMMAGTEYSLYGIRG